MSSVYNSDIYDQQEMQELEEAIIAQDKKNNEILAKLQDNGSVADIIKKLKRARGKFYCELLSLLRTRDITGHTEQLTKLINQSVTYNSYYLDELLSIYKPELNKLRILDAYEFTRGVTHTLSKLIEHYNVYKLCDQLDIWHIDEVRVFVTGKLSNEETFQLLQRLSNWRVSWLYPLIDSEFIYNKEFLLVAQGFSTYQLSLLYTNVNKLVEKLVVYNIKLSVSFVEYTYKEHISPNSLDILREWAKSTDNIDTINLFFGNYTYIPTIVAKDSTDSVIDPKPLSWIIAGISGELNNTPDKLGFHMQLLRKQYPNDFDDIMAEFVSRSFKSLDRHITTNLLSLYKPTLSKIGLVREGNIVGWRKLGETTRIDIPLHSAVILSKYYSVDNMIESLCLDDYTVKELK